MRINYLFIGCVSLLLSCGNSQKTNKKVSQSNMKLEAVINSHFKVTLQSNSSTGYSWKWVNKEEVKNIELLSSVYIDGVNKGPKAEVGIPGEEVWVFKGNKTGKYEMKMNYIGPGTTNEVSKSKTIQVTIK